MPKNKFLTLEEKLEFINDHKKGMKLKSLVSIDPLMSEKPLLSEQLFLAGPVYLRGGGEGVIKRASNTGAELFTLSMPKMNPFESGTNSEQITK